MVEMLPEERMVKKIYISRIARIRYYVLAAAAILVAVYLIISGVKNFLGISVFYLQAVFLLTGLLIIIVAEIRRRYHKYLITNKRVIKDSGILKNEVTAWEINMIVNIRIHESFFGRIFSYGTLDILLVDNNKMLLDYVRFPGKIMEQLTELVENYQK